MSQPADTRPDVQRPRKRRNLLVAGAVAATVLVALLTGVPQRLALEYGLRKTLNTDVHVRGLWLVPRVHIAELRVAGEPDAAPVILRGVDVAYSLNLEPGVTVSSVHIDSARVDYRRYAGGATNFAFLERLMHRETPARSAGEEPFDVTPYVPKTFGIADLSLAVESPDGAIELEGLQLETELESLAIVTARLLGKDLRGTLRVSDAGEERPLTGTLNVEFLSNLPSVGVSVKANIPDVVTLDGKVHFIVAPGAKAAQAWINEARFVDDEWTVLLPETVAFDTFDVSGTEFTVSSPPGVPWNLAADLHAEGKGVRYGEPGHEWYEGDLEVSGAYDGDRGEFEALLNRGQRLSVIAEGEPADAHVAATLVDWDRDDLADALPKDFRALLEELPHLSQIGASAEVQMQWPDYRVHASVDPLFTGDAGSSEKFAIRLDGAGTREASRQDAFHGTLHATLGGGELSAEIDAATPGRYTATLSLSAVDTARWLTPVRQRLPIAPPSGKVDGTLTVQRDATYRVETDLTLRDTAAETDVTLAGTAASDTPAGFLPLTGQAKVGLASAEPPGSAVLRFQISEEADLRVEGLLTTVDLASAVALAGLNELPDGLDASLSGRADVSRTVNGLAIALNLDAAPARLAGKVIPAEQPLHIEGNLSSAAAMTGLRAGNLALRLTDDAALDVGEFVVSFSPFAIEGHLTGKVDFDYVGPMLGMPTIVGALSIDAPLTINSSSVEGQVHLEGDGFGYGKWAGPYGTPVVARGLLRYEMAAGSAVVDDVEMKWGEGSQLTSEGLAVQLDPFTLSGPIAVTTDLTPLVDLRFFDAAEGTATLSGTLGIGADRTTTIAYDLAANSLTLAGAIAAFGGLSSTGSISYGESLDGQLGFAAADAAAAGAMLHDPRGTCTLEDGVATAKGVEASLYGGRVTFDAAANLLDAAAGGNLTAHLEAIDLDRFTKEYELPSVTLTGIANGDVSLAWNGDGLRDLRVDLASEKDFSMNREIIENLLLQSLTAGAAGMKRLTRIQQKTIGEAAQRPFDRASVSLSLDGETPETQRLLGPLRLESNLLNFSIDLRVDLLSITSAMELQQEARLGEGDTISAEPVQWSLPVETPGPQSNNSDAQSSSRAKEEES